jgi:hypothetical protein
MQINVHKWIIDTTLKYIFKTSKKKKRNCPTQKGLGEWHKWYSAYLTSVRP